MNYAEAVERLKKLDGGHPPVPSKPSKGAFDGFEGAPSPASTDFHVVEQATPQDPLPPLAPASEARRQKVLALLARDGGRYALYVENPEANPVIMAVATPDATGELLLIPKDRYDPFAVLAIVKEWEREAAEPAPLRGSVAITEAEIEAARKGRLVVRQGTFTGAPEVKA